MRTACKGGAPLGVIHPRHGRNLWRARNLDAQLVVAALDPLFGAVQGFAETFDPARSQSAARGSQRCEVELTWAGARVSSTWSVYLAGGGVRHVAVTVVDSDPAGADPGYASELPTVLSPLLGLAADTGARLFLGGVDVTGAGLADLVELVTPMA